MRIQFLGANRQVTGSRYLLEACGRRVMIDCGLFQERKCQDRNWRPSPVAPGDVDLVLLTHAHLDHCGLLPRFVAEGYGGRILATAPSIDLARVVMEDSARIHEEDASYKKKRHQREKRKGKHPEVPLYRVEDAEATARLFDVVRFDHPVEIGPGMRATYRDAGHILGSSMIEIEVEENGETRRIVFSGDVGQSDRPLLHDPTPVEEADYVILESTYGDRDHVADADIPGMLEKTINDTVERGGNLLIPTFAIDRAQEIMYFLGELVRAKRIPNLTIFIDSPMAINATTIYKRFRHMLDDDTQALIERGEHPFQFPGLHFVRGSRESKSINSIRGTCIVMAGSGMCTGGRIKHHLRQNLAREESTVLFVGYQADGTLGRRIVNGEDEVRIHGRNVPVRAKIEKLQGLSAHADRRGLLRWLGHFRTPPRRLFLTHGEMDAASALRNSIREQSGVEAEIPEYEEIVELD